MKTAVKMVIGLLVGICAGLLLAGLIVTLAKDMTWAEYFAKFDASVIPLFLHLFLAMVLAVIVQIAVHEAGHLVGGLMSGYRFVSYRVGSFALIRRDGKFMFKRFGIAGTGGQCLMLPPDRPIEQIRTMPYDLGGVVANLLLSVLCVIVLLCVDLDFSYAVYPVMMAIAGFGLAALNGIPININGMPNDGMQAVMLRKDMVTKRVLFTLLKAYALVQDGMRPRDLPTEWFDYEFDSENVNPLVVNILAMKVGVLLDRMEWEEARELCAALLEKENHIPVIFLYEFRCEYVFTLLMTGEKAKAAEIYADKTLQAYIRQTQEIMPSRQRLLCAVSLLLDNYRAKAEEIAAKVERNREQYISLGEAISELEIMKSLLREA
ncbi:MAG: hypothetical protein UHT92_04900 [Prevotella sp.]|nr:hypothetical protein [Prevotella sp.]